MQRKRGHRRWASLALVGLVALSAASAARAQIGGIGPGLPNVPGGGIPSGLADRTFGRLPQGLTGDVLGAPSRADDLIRRSRGSLEADPLGWPVVRSEIVVVDLPEEGREWVVAEGYTVLREERLEALDLTSTVLAPPRRMRLQRAIEQLRDRYPSAAVEYNHVFSPAGGMAESGSLASSAVAQAGAGARLGLVDTGIDVTHPALDDGRITQRAFAGAVRPGAHGTAVASLMVGRSDPFAGAWPGAALLAADVYGGRTDGGSSTALVQALDWLVGEGALVVNISLVGPRNSLVERAVERAQARGVILVAAVGNDGPAAAPLYPASYEGVIGVSAVSRSNRILPEAGRGPQVDFVGPGADMAAASPGGGYTTVRGTSFASPVIAALIARHGGGRAGVAAAAREARDLGEEGPDYTYGIGLTGENFRIYPQAVGARGRLDR